MFKVFFSSNSPHTLAAVFLMDQIVLATLEDLLWSLDEIDHL